MDRCNVVSALKARGIAVKANEGPDFHDVDLELGLGEAVAMTSIGPADLRKLLEVLAGLQSPEAGKISWNRIPALSVLDEKSATPYRRYRARRGLRQLSGYVSASLSLINDLTLFENISLPLVYHFNTPERIVEERTYRLLNLLKLEDVAEEQPAGLPLGITRRASLGRALILEPMILFLDSPLSDIDNDSADIFLSVLRYFRERAGLAVLAASFDPRSLLPLVSRVIVFHEGVQTCVLEGSELLETEFFECMSKLTERRRRDEVEV